VQRELQALLVFETSKDYGTVLWRKELRPGVLADSERDSVDGEQDLSRKGGRGTQQRAGGGGQAEG